MQIVAPTNVGDRELGTSVVVPFTTADPLGLPTSVVDGTLIAIETDTKTTYSGVAVVADFDILGIAGLHRAVVDTTASFFRNGHEYLITFSAGTVAGVSLIGQICGVFAIGARSEGLILRRVVKCHSGTVTQVGSPNTRRFRADFVGIDSVNPDFYRTQEINFQSGVNAGIGRSILSYTPATREFLVQKAFPLPIELGATFVLIPHERELTIYTAHIEVEWGVGQGVGDRISVVVLEDGEMIPDPASVVESMTLQTWDFDTDVQIANVALTPAPNAKVYRYTSQLAQARAPNAGLNILATFSIDGRTHSFPKTVFNYH